MFTMLKLSRDKEFLGPHILSHIFHPSHPWYLAKYQLFWLYILTHKIMFMFLDALFSLFSALPKRFFNSAL